MTVRPAGVLRLGRRAFEASQLLVVAAVAVEASRDPAGAMERVDAVVTEGADVVEVSDEAVVALAAAHARAGSRWAAREGLPLLRAAQRPVANYVNQCDGAGRSRSGAVGPAAHIAP